LLITLIITGITTFTLLLWWRTSFDDFLELSNPYALSKNLSDRELALKHRMIKNIQDNKAYLNEAE
jgi:hypothetical protein